MTSEEQPQTEVGESVGQQLRRARERKGLSVAEVAESQHLRPSVIQAIENSDHRQFDGELFLKGYVRAYARQVGLDPDRLIADLDRELEPLRREREKQQESNPLVDIERRRRRKRRIAKALFLAMLVLVGGLLAFRFLVESPSPGEAPVPREETGEAQPSESGMPDVAEPEPDMNGAEADADRDAPVPVEPEEPVVVSEPLSELPAQEGSPVAGETAETPVDEASAQPAVAADDASDNIADLTPRLEMSFQGDCWVQVSDGEGRRLVAALQRRGDRLEVSGPAPLHVVIGAVDAVSTIQFQDAPVDLGQFPVTNNRAEFTLSP